MFLGVLFVAEVASGQYGGQRQTQREYQTSEVSF